MSTPIVGTVFTGDKFGVDYVNNLYAMIKRNTTKEFDFVCIIDRLNSGLHSKILQTRRQTQATWGWWNFMEFYSSDWGEDVGSRIYFGLDTVIHGNIDFVLERRDYTLSLDFNYLIGNPNPRYAGTYADCAAVIPAGGMEWLYQEFLCEHEQDNLGNSNYPMHVWVTHKLRERSAVPALWQNVKPDAMCSYKWPEPKTERPVESMVFFHGQPMVHEVLSQSPWIREHWHSEDL